MPKKALIVYGTRFGATTSTSEEIGNVLRKEGVDVRVVNAKKEKVHDISSYDLVIVGSGMMVDRWTGEAKKFLSKFRRQLANKKVALFVSSGGLALLEREARAKASPRMRDSHLEGVERVRRSYLEARAAKYNLKPIALGLFGGVWDFNRTPWWSGGAMAAIRQKLRAAGMTETRPGVYDMRDWYAIRDWARQLAAHV